MTNPAHAPASGWFEGNAFHFPVRVYYEDTDFSGVVYHAGYLRFMEQGRSEFLRAAELPHTSMLAAPEPLVWAVRRMSIGFDRPARLEDALTVRTRVAALKGARMQLAQEVWRGETLLINADVEVCLLTLDGKPRRVPDAVRKVLESYLPA